MTEGLSKPLDCVESMLPDIYCTYHDIPFIVVEIKTPGEECRRLLLSDKLKLYCEMKSALHQLLERGVVDPQVLGFLVQCKLLTKLVFNPL
jgi:hypothetical protein